MFEYAPAHAAPQVMGDGEEAVGAVNEVLAEWKRSGKPQGAREHVLRNLASVPGVAQAPLSDERLAALLNWVIEEFGGAEGIVPYEVAEISGLRNRPLRAPRETRDHITQATTSSHP